MITFHEALFAKDQPRSEEKLTKREMFAAMAMQALLSNHVVIEAFAATKDHPHGELISTAVANADALIAELAKDPK